MKAIRVVQFGAPAVMRLEEVADPTPGPGQLLLRVRAAGVNPVDTYLRSGAHARRPALPYTPGFDAAGVVEAVDEGVRGFVPGQRVYAAGTLSGSYAQLALCALPQVHALPERASFEQGAALGVPYATAYRALFQRAAAKASELVLIHGGSGGVGIAALQFCRWRGLRAVATAGSERGRALASAQGAERVLDHNSKSYEEELLAWTGRRGFDVVVEMLANVNLARDLALLAPGGRVIIIGSRGTIEIDPRAAMAKDADVRGMSLFNASARDLAEAHAAIAAGVAEGGLAPVIAQSLPLAQAAQAHEAVMKPGAHGRIVLLP